MKTFSIGRDEGASLAPLRPTCLVPGCIARPLYDEDGMRLRPSETTGLCGPHFRAQREPPSAPPSSPVPAEEHVAPAATAPAGLPESALEEPVSTPAPEAPARPNPFACRLPGCQQPEGTKIVARGLHGPCYSEARKRGIFEEVALPPQPKPKKKRAAVPVEEPIEPVAVEPTVLLLVDLDGDGVHDLVVGSPKNPGCSGYVVLPEGAPDSAILDAIGEVVAAGQNKRGQPNTPTSEAHRIGDDRRGVTGGVVRQDPFIAAGVEPEQHRPRPPKAEAPTEMGAQALGPPPSWEVGTLTMLLGDLGRRADELLAAGHPADAWGIAFLTDLRRRVCEHPESVTLRQVEKVVEYEADLRERARTAGEVGADTAWFGLVEELCRAGVGPEFAEQFATTRPTADLRTRAAAILALTFQELGRRVNHQDAVRRAWALRELEELETHAEELRNDLVRAYLAKIPPTSNGTRGRAVALAQAATALINEQRRILLDQALGDGRA